MADVPSTSVRIDPRIERWVLDTVSALETRDRGDLGQLVYEAWMLAPSRALYDVALRGEALHVTLLPFAELTILQLRDVAKKAPAKDLEGPVRQILALGLRHGKGGGNENHRGGS